MTDIRGIHYEISEPVHNDIDGYYYQRRRQVDDHGNLVGEGDQLIKLPKPESKDGQYVPGLDWAKIGKLGGDVGQVGYGVIKRDPGTVARGASSFVKDIQNGFFQDFTSWPGTERPWEHGDIPAPPFDGRSSLDVPFAGTTASAAGITPDNPDSPASSPDAQGPIGLFSGKPMRFPFAPIFQPRPPMGATGDPDRSTALDDMIWNGLRSRASSRDGDAAPPLAPDIQMSSGNANGSGSSSSPSRAGFASSMPVPPDSQGPLSLNDAYLEYLRLISIA